MSVYQETAAELGELDQEQRETEPVELPEGDADDAQETGTLGQIRELFDGTPELAASGVRWVFTALRRGNKVLAGRLKVWWRSDRGPHTFVLVAGGGLLYLFPEGMGAVLAAWWVTAAFANGIKKPAKDTGPGEKKSTGRQETGQAPEGEQREAVAAQEPEHQPVAGHGPVPCDDTDCEQCFEDDAPAPAPPVVATVDLVKDGPAPADVPLSDDDLILKVTEWVVAEAPERRERGAHAAQILARLQTEHQRFPVWKTAELTARLRELGVPVERQLKVGGSPLPGVRYDELQQWLGRAPSLGPGRVPDVTPQD